MKEILIDLWNGNLAPIEKSGLGDPRNYELTERMAITRERLEKELNDKQKTLLKEFSEANDQYMLFVGDEAFCDGFRVCGKLMLEIIK